MASLTRRELLILGAAASAGLAPPSLDTAPDVHQEILALAARQERARRARFAAVRTKDDLKTLQRTLRARFLRLIGNLPSSDGAPPAKTTGRIDADDYVIEKVVFESFPHYHVPALLYRPARATTGAPGVISPCGHSAEGKAAPAYQTLHINMAKRGYVVLCYDPVGQGERSQFWDQARHRSRYNLGCGEHAVLGNPLYLVGSSLARYRIWDGIRAIDYLSARPEVDPARIGCVGNSGGGTLTAYITALDSRIAVAAIGCYITTLPRRMGNRIEEDPASDPEQDIAGFVSEEIDHAGLLALCAPRPTLIASAQLDFFPIEGARETFHEAQRLYEAAGVGERIAQVEAPERHGLTLPLREGVYRWFERWLAGRNDGATQELPVRPHPPAELQVCAEGQVNVSFGSRPMLALAREQFVGQRAAARRPLAEILRIDTSRARPRIDELGAATGSVTTLVVCVNGNEAPDWRSEGSFVRGLTEAGAAVVLVDPRGVATTRPNRSVRGASAYADPLVGVEENLAYNAFLVGESLMGLRVADILAAVNALRARWKPRQTILCARRDAALAACFAAALDPAIDGVATENLLRSYTTAFFTEGFATNASIIVPRLLSDFGDVHDVLSAIAPRRVLIAAGVGDATAPLSSVQVTDERFTTRAQVLHDWLKR